MFEDTGSTPASVAQTCGRRAIVCPTESPRTTDTIAVTVEQLISARGDVVASTVLDRAPCMRAECIISRMTPR